MANPALQSFEGEELPKLTRTEQEILRQYTHACLTLKKLTGQLLSGHLELGYREVKNLKDSIVGLTKQKKKLALKFRGQGSREIRDYV